MNEGCEPVASGTPLTGRSRGSIYRNDDVSEQLAADAFGRHRPVSMWTRWGARLRHMIGIHMVIPTVEAETTEDGVLKNIRVVQECAFCTWRG